MNAVERYWDRTYPFFFGAVAAIFALIYGGQAIAWAIASSIDLAAFFTSIFDLMAILTAFLFAFFGIAIAPGGGFIEKIMGTRVFRHFVVYVTIALGSGFTAAIASIPLIIVPERMLAQDYANYYITVWVFIVVSSLFSFWRVASVFLVWLKANGPFRRTIAV